ncbi:hypothetical protein H4582DRAFT_1925568 [Lactarius indigo]|nr:hypothetical protein H4582DRAFT_1925568 [Lactarius indigo]
MREARNIRSWGTDLVCWKWSAFSGTTHTGHLSEEKCSGAVSALKGLQTHLHDVNPLQPYGAPHRFEDILCVREQRLHAMTPRFWSEELQFEPWSIRREQPVAEHIQGDTYSFRVVTHVVVPSAETTTTPTNLTNFPHFHAQFSATVDRPLRPPPPNPLACTLSSSELQDCVHSLSVFDYGLRVPTFSCATSNGQSTGARAQAVFVFDRPGFSFPAVYFLTSVDDFT